MRLGRLSPQSKKINVDQRAELAQICGFRSTSKALTEQFTEGVVIMKHLFGWKLSSYSTHRRWRNRPKAESFGPAILALVGKRNRFDRALYEFGKKMFEDAAARADFDFQRETAALKMNVNRGALKSVSNFGPAAFRAVASRVLSVL
jgi:hypothetical protein